MFIDNRLRVTAFLLDDPQHELILFLTKDIAPMKYVWKDGRGRREQVGGGSGFLWFLLGDCTAREIADLQIIAAAD